MDPGEDLPVHRVAGVSTSEKEIALSFHPGYNFLNDGRILMYGQPIQVQAGIQSFAASRFQPAKRVGAFIAPPIVGPVVGPGVVVRRDPAVILPQEPMFFAPRETVAFVEEDNTTKTIITIAAVIGIFALGAAIL